MLWEADLVYQDQLGTYLQWERGIRASIRDVASLSIEIAMAWSINAPILLGHSAGLELAWFT